MKPMRTLVSLVAVSTIACQSQKSHTEAVEQKTAPAPTPSPTPAPPQPAVSTGDKGPALGDMGKVGRVNFPTVCDQALQPTFERAVALLHSFFYSEARKAFTEITQKDPQCAIAFWGIAMTWYHPLWTPPPPDDFDKGSTAIDQAAKATKKNERDQLFVDALAGFYHTAAGAPGAAVQSCHGTGVAFPARAQAWNAGMKKAFDKFPADEEVAAFYALTLLAAASPTDLEYKNQKQSAEILEKLWAARQDHPGVAHYLIHAYDYPPLATKGLAAAKAYASIAPTVPHALHMPSHIFVRLGMWQDAIDGNIKSSQAAAAYAARDAPGATSFDELHALDYLEYSYLQLGRNDAAKEIAERIPTIKKTVPEVDFVAAYALASIPARYVVERHAWKEASTLALPDVPFWSKFPHNEAHVEYARGLGLAHLGDIAGAKKSMARLTQLRDLTTDPKFGYFQKHLALQVEAVGAWITYAEGKKDEAVAALRKAADAEDKLGKHPVSPGPIIPIYEQLGDMLIELKRPADALPAYEAALKTSPRRFNSLYGAGHAAELAKNAGAAKKYYQELVDMVGDGAQRPEATEAKKYLAKK
jgi:tetratricopeptide (TPR) repeat protein